MERVIDMTGQKFGHWTVLGRCPVDAKHKKARWNCVCVCGKVKAVRGYALREGRSTSCGCSKNTFSPQVREEIKNRRWPKQTVTEVETEVKAEVEETRPPASEKHGMRKSKEYKSWAAMKQRCTNPHATNYPSHGGRGIRMCDRWLNSFSAFLEDMGKRPGNEYAAARIDLDGNYSCGKCEQCKANGWKANCRWKPANVWVMNGRKPKKVRRERQA